MTTSTYKALAHLLLHARLMFDTPRDVRPGAVRLKKEIVKARQG